MVRQTINSASCTAAHYPFLGLLRPRAELLSWAYCSNSAVALSALCAVSHSFVKISRSLRCKPAPRFRFHESFVHATEVEEDTARMILG
jgi:hypothetical protein